MRATRSTFGGSGSAPAPAATSRAAATAGALLALTAAMVVIALGVIATTGVYGSRLAWMLGVALPLLALSMLLSNGSKAARVVFASAGVVVAVPLVLALMLLAVYGLFFVAHGISMLL